MMVKQRLERNPDWARNPFFTSLASVIPPSRTVIDLGAGIGECVMALRRLGYEATGLDGTPGIDDLTDGMIQWADLTGDCGRYFGKADWGLFLEVGEHVPVDYEGDLIGNVSRIPREGLIVSWASPGRTGRGHVNCRPPDYVADRFAERGWAFHRRSTGKVNRNKGRSGRNRHLMVFCRKGGASDAD